MTFENIKSTCASWSTELNKLITPFARVKHQNIVIMLICQIALLFGLWSINSFEFLPTPYAVYVAFFRLLNEQSLIAELWVSLKLCLKSMFYATIISSIVAYLSTIPLTKYMAYFVTKGRFLTLVGLSFFFTVLTSGGAALKTSLLVFSITVFFSTSYIAYVRAVDETKLNHARTLGLNPWQTLFEVIIFGTLADLIIVVAQTFAIAWMMLTMVEGIVKSEGGIGVLLLANQKFFHLDSIAAIQIMIFILGITLDYLIGLLREVVAPHTKYEVQNK
jgi:ABC-type nitrate/sulfonate/bicarbonate transport system permease component